MDLSYLKTSNQILRFVDTKRLFFNKYPYRVKVFSPGIRSHIAFKGDMNKILIREKRLLETGIPNLWNDTWSKNYYKTDHNVNNLIYKKIRLNKFPKFRVEFPFINLYFELKEDMVSFIDDMDAASFSNFLHEISLPNQQTENLLTEDTIIVKRIDEKYKFKVTINGGVITKNQFEQRQNLLSYLYSLGDQIYKANFSSTRSLSSYNYYYSPTYFYCTDEKILVFLQLAYPGLIGKTFKVVKV